LKYNKNVINFSIFDKQLHFLLDKIMDNLLNISKGTDKATRSSPKVTWEHSWSSDDVQSGLINSPFRLLPTEVMLHIFKFLSVHDLGNISSLCRLFKMIADQDEIWKLKCKCKCTFIPFFLH
jgi:hypothetical protein